MKYVRNCEQCRRRKLKCDRVIPCGPCKLRNVTEQCTFAPNAQKPLEKPLQRKRRRRGSREAQEPGDEEDCDDDGMLLPDDEELLQLCAEHIFTEDTAISHFIAKDDLEKRVHARRHKHDPAFRAVLLALYGVVVSMFEEAPSLEPRKLFEACQRDLARSDPDTCPCLDQVRAYFLLVVGLGLAAGPYVAASLLSRACYLSQILDLHVEPRASLPHAEKEDRIRLFSTICKADWFSATGLCRNFYHIRPSAVLFPSLFGSSSQRASFLEPGFWISMQMADLSREISDRDGMEPKLAYEETMRLQYGLLGFESALADETDPFVAPRERSKRMQDRMGIEHLRFALHKPFYLEGWHDAARRPSRDICFRSTVKYLQLLHRLFTSTIAASEEEGLLPDSRHFTRLWYHVFKGIQCALIISRHLALLDEHRIEGGWDYDTERNVATKTLASTRQILRELSVRSAVARQGLEALKDQAMNSSALHVGQPFLFDPLGPHQVPSSPDSETPAAQDVTAAATAAPSSSSPSSSLAPQRHSTSSCDNNLPDLFPASKASGNTTISQGGSFIEFDLDEFLSNTTTDNDFWGLFSWLDPTLLNSRI
ncbi:hypothetical protein FA10DRAFT_268758 [Acaromyces ingoldii]|uniref:Zn(2)-C6 fungal-type domain-containing protein n=1 Tax=Acaromyces ingoldii TaxID=215250 RepID=A0A316YHF8_9BASI|nr:hypothetical protein FA10DRAFT_268758 [Acaromyces ingoldii]PWN88581.1 hypothetical protein FA10DRAFT_268758 [Acaromyces ingoldii]